MLSFECIKNEKSVYFLLTSAKTSPRGSLLGSTVQHRGGAAQNKPEDTTAREFNGQPSPAPRQSCPKQAGRHHREEV